MDHSDDDLQLVPVNDDATKQVAPDLSHKAGVRLIPVICSACRTRLYAGENQVGLWKKCPDCGRLTEIHAVDPKFLLVADDPEAAGGYEVGEAGDGKKEAILALVAERQKAEAAKPKDDRRLPPPTFVDRPPLMEGLLDRLLKSEEEKKEEQRVARREARIAEEAEAVKKAVREGKLDEHLAKSQGASIPSDPAERKRREKQRAFEAASSVPPSPPQPPPLPSGGRGSSSEKPSRPRRKTEPPDDSFVAPILDTRSRSRMLILLFCGFFGNLFGEKSRSMIWQVLADNVYGQTPGYSYGMAENGLLLTTFWIGNVLSLVWLALLFLFGISIFLSTSRGEDRVGQWIPFNLDFGFSYVGWSLLILLVSLTPGLAARFVIDAWFPAWRGVFVPLQILGPFLFFPILFLCLIESDSFYGSAPRKTLRSLKNRPGLWLRFYAFSSVLLGVPAAFLALLLYLGATFADEWIMQSALYYLVAAILLTLGGFSVLLYFRLLGFQARALDVSDG